MRSLNEAILSEFSASNAKAWTTQLTQFHRPLGSSGYHAATEFVRGLLGECGLQEVEVETYPLDGKTVVAGQRMPPAWEPREATLELVSPSWQLLTSFEKVPSCLACWSSSTPEEGVTAEVIDVGTGEHASDFQRADVTGRVVFVQGTAREARGWQQATRLAIAHGAKGIITDYLLCQAPPWRTRESVPDAVQALRLPWTEHNVWAFAVDHHVAGLLRELLSRGEVVVKARVEARRFAGFGQNLSATIEGESVARSLFVVTHISAPTRPASNCAAGVATAVEVARTITALRRRGAIPTLRRSIRFLFLAEGVGSVNYLHRHQGELAGALMAFNVDSVGHDPAKCDSALIIGRAVDSQPSFVSDYVMTLATELPREADSYYRADRAVSLIPLCELPYTPWGDDRYWSTFGIPTVTMLSWPDRYFHTQLLTPDKTSELVFRRAGTLIATALADLATMGAVGAARVARWVAARAESRLAEAASQGYQETVEAKGNGTSREPLRLARGRLQYLASRDTRALDSIDALLVDEAPEMVDRVVNWKSLLSRRLQTRAIEEQRWLEESVGVSGDEAALAEPALVSERDRGGRSEVRGVPVKAREGFLHGISGWDYGAQVALSEQMRQRDPKVRLESLSVLVDEVWNLCDGERTVSEIADTVGHEFDLNLGHEPVGEILERMSKAGLIIFRSKGGSTGGI